MTTIKFPNYAATMEAATRWTARMDRGLSEQEQQQLRDWLAESSLHGEALVHAASMWDLLDVLQPISELLPMSAVRFEDPAQASNRHGNTGRLALAASVALLAGALGVTFWLQADRMAPTEPVAATRETSEPARIIRHFQTDVGEITTFKLDDQSTIQLNTDSAVSVEYSDAERRIDLLQGEVFFDVADDSGRPFVVVAGNDRVTAVGTAFSVDASNEHSMEVIVTEGKVMVKRSDDTSTTAYADVVLTPGQRVVVRDDQPDVSTEDDPEAALAWREGFIVFNGEPLAQAVSEIGRYTPLSFRISDPDLAAIPVGGYFKAGDLDQLLLVLEQNFGVAHERSGNELLLSKSAP